MKAWLGKKLSATPICDSRLIEILELASTVIYGKSNELRMALCCFLADGHLLVEDSPGVGKTTFVSTLAQLLGLQISRIQFTNDLLPADVLGSSIFNEVDRKFHFHPGPIFSEIVLGDELNRANPKTQSAFLQAMEERAVTIDGQYHKLPAPFLIVCTQNPQNQIGTYPLPESQLDRFMFRLSLGYPDSESEIKMLSSPNPRLRIPQLKPLLNPKDFIDLQARALATTVAAPIVKYVQSLLTHSRSNGVGLSPRAGLLMIQSAKAWAYLDGRDFVLPEDIQQLAPAVFDHRMPVNSSMTAAQLVKSVPVP
jgi:MoxR-like ATPase